MVFYGVLIFLGQSTFHRLFTCSNMKREELFCISFWDFNILITKLNDRRRKCYTTKYEPYLKSYHRSQPYELKSVIELYLNILLLTYVCVCLYPQLISHTAWPISLILFVHIYHCMFKELLWLPWFTIVEKHFLLTVLFYTTIVLQGSKCYRWSALLVWVRTKMLELDLYPVN